MPWIFGRITHPHSAIETIVNWLNSNSLEAIIVRETASNEHIHFHLNFEKTFSTFTQRFRKKFPNLDGNEKKSFKQTKDTQQDIFNVDCYCCKGNDENTLPDVALAKLPKYTQEYIKECHDAYWKVNQSLKHKNKKEEKISAVDAVIEILPKQEFDNWNSIAKMVIYKHTMKYLNGKVLDDFIVKRIVYGVANKLGIHEFHKEQFYRLFGEELDI
jgi:hypothetical protein